jgi:hypothetical protein
MAACEAGCGREAVDGRPTCGGEACGPGLYDSLVEALLNELDAQAVFVVVLNGSKGSDCSLQFKARDAEHAELWGRRMVSQARIALEQIDQELNDASNLVPTRPTEQGH